MSALRKDGCSVNALKACLRRDAVEEKSPAVEESSHGVEESSHGFPLTRGGGQDANQGAVVRSGACAALPLHALPACCGFCPKAGRGLHRFSRSHHGGGAGSKGRGARGGGNMACICSKAAGKE